MNIREQLVIEGTQNEISQAKEKLSVRDDGSTASDFHFSRVKAVKACKEKYNLSLKEACDMVNLVFDVSGVTEFRNTFQSYSR